MKPLPEAVALRAKIAAEGVAWDADTFAAARAILRELDVARRKHWREMGGAARLATCLADFETRYFARSSERIEQ